MQKIIGIALGFGCLINGCSSAEASYRVNKELSSPFVTDADNQRYDDSRLAKTLQGKLRTNLNDSAIQVVVKNNQVLLVGQVISLNDKTTAATIAAKYPSVTKVFNHLSINPKPSLNLDLGITSQARDRILRQYDLNDKDLSIITVDNIVYILGTNVGNLTALDRVISNGIYSIEGVKKVVNLEQLGINDYTTQ